MQLIYENAILANTGKRITFTTIFGKILHGYIQGGQQIDGVFSYQVSLARKPRTPFSYVNGSWYAVNPASIIEMNA